MMKPRTDITHPFGPGLDFGPLVPPSSRLRKIIQLPGSPGTLGTLGTLGALGTPRSLTKHPKMELIDRQRNLVQAWLAWPAWVQPSTCKMT